MTKTFHSHFPRAQRPALDEAWNRYLDADRVASYHDYEDADANANADRAYADYADLKDGVTAVDPALVQREANSWYTAAIAGIGDMLDALHQQLDAAAVDDYEATVMAASVYEEAR